MVFGALLGGGFGVPAWLKALVVVALLSAAFVWWWSRGGSSPKAGLRGGGTSGGARGVDADGALVSAMAGQLRLAAEDVERARRERSRVGQQRYLYGAQQRLSAIWAAAAGDEGRVARMGVQANLSIAKLNAYVEKAMAMLGEDGDERAS
jgi:hypothetical protein